MEQVELEFPRSLQEMLESCETVCVAECCGMEAFEFSEKNIQGRLLKHPRQKDAVRERLAKIHCLVECSNRNICWTSGRLGFMWTGKRLNAFFEDLKNALKGVS
jgi:hypothetical protein